MSVYFRPGGAASHVLTALLCLLLGGCTGTGEQVSDRSRHPTLPYPVWVQSAPPGELKTELTRLIEKEAPATPGDAVRLALIIGHVHQGSLDNAPWARDVLGQADTEPGLEGVSTSYLGPGELWDIILTQRDRLHETKQELSGSRQRIRELEADIRALEKQIEELTSVEQEMVEQEQDQ